MMRAAGYVIGALFALVVSAGSVGALDAAKVAEINKAADAFVALAADSAKTGQPPRQSDPAAKPLLDTVFDTTELQRGAPGPMSELALLNDWNLAVIKVGLIYVLAGTGVSEAASIQSTPEMIQQINRNTVAFAPEAGRYTDAQLWVEVAVVDTVVSYVASAPQAELDRPNMRSGLAQIRAGLTQSVTGVISMLPLAGLTDAWRRDRLLVLSVIAPKAAKFLLPGQLSQLREAASAAAAQMSDPAVKSALTSFAAAL